MPRRGFGLGVLARETVRNLGSAPALLTLAVIMGLASGLAVPLVTAMEVGSVVRDDLAAVAAGTNTLSVAGENRGPISAARCDQLNAISGVISAGGVVSRASVNVASRPNESLELVRGTVGLAAIFWPGDQLDPSKSVAFVSGSRNAVTFGITEGAPIAFSKVADQSTTTTIVLSQIAAPSTRKTALDSAFFEVVPPVGSIVECLVEASPGARDKVESILVGWFPLTSATSVSPYFQLTDPGSTTEQKLHDRLSQHFPLAALIVTFTTVIAVWYSRRSEFALYRSLGLKKVQFLLLLVLETVVLVFVPIHLGLSLSLYFLTGQLGSLVVQLALLDGTRLLSLLPLIPLLSFLLLIRSIRLDTLKGR
ncbi:FtsX-like permease family protein [Cryobacterium sinapicolor]|uniref:FtsX-like permease family protein n=1 Tax=Cryobacterium sinapicolor TaxID=1259236 RepID=A0ABY2J8X4_9MICO|nr:FtsX-like permease family protein [Cryobacterium sinapicolor]TFD00504.1 FtsX-like permease family protein [Cryobacterium sinapicolor]